MSQYLLWGDDEHPAGLQCLNIFLGVMLSSHWAVVSQYLLWGAAELPLFCSVSVSPCGGAAELQCQWLLLSDCGLSFLQVPLITRGISLSLSASLTVNTC